MKRFQILMILSLLLFAPRLAACENDVGFFNVLHVPLGIVASVGVTATGYVIDGVRLTAMGPFYPAMFLLSERKGKETLVSYWAWDSTESWRCPL